uniref:Sulfotransferase n=1 Tax=Amphora coffeiformis TaxID=265554 RepID=A0A7S3P9B3_9STRA|mmetsp:Transcript_8676/g.16530  ORF Transcript_8676/g.16530 Transcript_8676/m.16530 type:complete len:117 (+) Transcript_8676:646-996(+)
MWSKWNREYFDADFPRLFVRFEDMIFNAEKVMQEVANCAGLSVHQPYLGMLEPSKEHGNSSGLITAMVRYGTDVGRADGLLSEDIKYANKELDVDLMRRFQYNKVESDSSRQQEPP